MASEQMQFKFKGYRVTKSVMQIIPSGEVDQKLNVIFSGINDNVEGSIYMLDLGASITNEKKSIEIEIEMRGFFEFNQELSQEMKATFFTMSAPTIMFPYIRAYISTISGAAGIQPIILPTINFAEGLRAVAKSE